MRFFVRFLNYKAGCVPWASFRAYAGLSTRHSPHDAGLCPLKVFFGDIDGLVLRRGGDRASVDRRFGTRLTPQREQVCEG